ncbi:hypothetical protein CLIB1444_08S05754 [[Candida] jaroonii]|uniref:Uncharacterized protein n=1 Tax=[Candida] jaroonii TaxID=467808 RepID=A0ACA9YCT8_9ASCO|nr:hypothetical protein CLIB1444_08S05754 [[Candida] jaroonii]
MWPQKNGLGQQLTYGVPGIGTIIPSTEDQPELRIEYPHSNGAKLKKVLENATELRPRQNNRGISTAKQPEKHKSKKNIDQTVAGLSFTDDLIKTYNNTGHSLSVNAYDPTFGSLLQFFFIKNHQGIFRNRRMAAFASGENGNILEIAAVEPTGVVAYMDLEYPELKNSVTLTLKEPIRQILAYNIPSNASNMKDLILVRSQFKIYILHCVYNKAHDDSSIISLVGEISSTELKCKQFADICFSPKGSQIMAVDVEGTLFTIRVDDKFIITWKKIEVKPEYADIYINSYELSIWRRIIWVSTSTVFIASRSSLIKLDLLQSSVQKIITSDTWSSIRDIKVPNAEKEDMFILTSKEIIWVSTKDSIPRRLIAWKHFLTDKDPSYKLEVKHTEGKFICLAYSQISPLAITFTFGRVDNKPYILSSPSIIHVSGNSSGIQTIIMEELEKDFFRRVKSSKPRKETLYSLFDIRQNLAISITTLGYKERTQNYKNPHEINFDQYLEDITLTSLRPFAGKYFANLTKSEVLPLIKDLIRAPVSKDDVSVIQNFASELGMGTSRMKASEETGDLQYSSLLDLSVNPPPFAGDLEEFDDMIEQLMDHVSGNNLEASEIADRFLSKILNGDVSNMTVTGLYEVIVKKYFKYRSIKLQTRGSSTKVLAVLLIAASIKIGSPALHQQYEKLITNNLEASSSSTKAILKDWDNFGKVVEPEVSTQAGRQFVIPSINIASQDTSTQKRKSNSKSKSLRKRALTASQRPSQFSSSQIPSSQIPSSQIPSSNHQISSQIPSSPPHPPSSSPPRSSQSSQANHFNSQRTSQINSQRPSQRNSQKSKRKRRGF